MLQSKTVASTCTLCAHDALELVVDFGMQPPANRFVTADVLKNDLDTFPLGLGFCTQCKTVQLAHRMPLSQVEPRYPWILYNEPELHLDDVAFHLSKLPGIGPSSQVLGVSYKDQSTIDRLTRFGLSPGKCFTKESFNLFQSPVLSGSHSLVDLLLARHVIEHAQDAVGLIQQLKTLLKPNGYLVMEVPDSEKLLRVGNHAFIWEEHVSYFTEYSLPLLAKKAGGSLVWVQSYPYPYENSLMAVIQFNRRSALGYAAPKPAPATEELLYAFQISFARAKVEWKNLLEEFREKGEKVAVFGAGHLAVKWINFLDISSLIDCVIDDNAHKVGMLMPGSRLPIYPSVALKEREIRTCISTLSPESEQKVRRNLSKYFHDGGQFIPAFKTVELDS